MAYFVACAVAALSLHSCSDQDNCVANFNALKAAMPFGGMTTAVACKNADFANNCPVMCGSCDEDGNNIGPARVKYTCRWEGKCGNWPNCGAGEVQGETTMSNGGPHNLPKLGCSAFQDEHHKQCCPTCEKHACASGTTPIPGAEGTRINDFTEDEAQSSCCQVTCASFKCPEGYGMKANSAEIVGSSESECCTKCGAGMVSNKGATTCSCKTVSDDSCKFDSADASDSSKNGYFLATTRSGQAWIFCMSVTLLWREKKESLP
eukprot:m.239751 g.239751  ORF g.239751 m.239751 type:complete len:263 (-) comp16072_c0_seq7:2414-3202(-)